jgi:hypothetical protein
LEERIVSIYRVAVALKVEALYPSETLVTAYKLRRRHNSEDTIFTFTAVRNLIPHILRMCEEKILRILGPGERK